MYEDSNPRDSTASGGFASIGNMLSSPYDEDRSNEYEIIHTPATPSPQGEPIWPIVQSTLYNSEPRVRSVRQSTYQPPAKDGLIERIRSFEGELNGIRESVNYDEGDPDEVLSFDQAAPSTSSNTSTSPKRSPGSGRVRPPSIIHFPQPTFVSPVTSPSPIRLVPPPLPRVQIPQALSPPTNPASPAEHTIPALPSSGTPISPHLALPPLTPPRSPYALGPGARSSMSSLASETSVGYDVMKEKRALFREGQEELLSPFSPRRQESGLRSGPRNGGNRGVSTVDFWKRFSVVVRMDQAAPAGGKESAWLNEAQSKRRSIRWIALLVVAVTLVIAGGIAAIVVIVPKIK